MKILTSEDIRKCDQYTILHEPVSSVQLMERAALACTNWIAEHCKSHKNIAVFCGTGNNGEHPFLTVQLPPGKVPTAVAVTPGNEMAQVDVWDVNELKGQMGVIALGSNRDHQLMMIPSTAFFTASS